MKNKYNFNYPRPEEFDFSYLGNLSELTIEKFEVAGLYSNYVIGIGEDNEQPFRCLAVVVRPLSYIDLKFYRRLAKRVKHFAIPTVLIATDNGNDPGYYYWWLKKPGKKGLRDPINPVSGLYPLKKKSLQKIINKAKNWYAYVTPE